MSSANEWPMVKLSEICSLDYGAAFKSSQFNTDGRGLPVIRIRDVERGFSETFYYGDFEPRYLVENGDFLIGMDGKFSIAEWNGGQALLNQRVCRVARRTSDGVHARYVFHYLPRALQTIEQRKSFVTVKHLSAKDLNNLEVPLPPLTEQQRIAEILDSTSSTLDLTKEEAKKIDKSRSALFEALYPAAGYDTATVGDFLAETQYGSSKKAGEQGEYPMLRMGNLSATGNISYSDLKYLKLEEKELSKYTLQNRDVIFNRTNSKELVGKTAVYYGEDRKVSYAGYLIRCRTNDRADPEFISGFLNSRFGKAQLFLRAKAIVGMANINAQELRTLRIPAVPVEEQEKYTTAYQHLEDIRLMVEKKIEKFEELQMSLSTRAFAAQL